MRGVPTGSFEPVEVKVDMGNFASESDTRHSDLHGLTSHSTAG